MNSLWDDYVTLMFKRAVLLAEQAKEVITRYLRFLRRAATIGLCFFSLLLLCFVACVAFGVQSLWLYQTLTLLMTGVLLVMIVAALPLLVSSEAVYGVLPERLKEGLLAWQRRGAAILFGGLLGVVLIRVFRLWQSPATMLTVLPIVALLWLGGYLGWLRTSGAWRKVLALKLQVTLIVIAVVSVLPGPAALVEELVDWAGARVEATVFGVTRPTPERWDPASVDELQFVDHGTGRYLVWYDLDKEGRYQLFKSKGYGDSGRPLKSAESEEEFTAIRNWQRARDTERETARRVQEQQAAQRAAEQAKEAERLRVEHETARRVQEQQAAQRAAEQAKEAERLRVEREAARRVQEQQAAARAAERAREAERVRRASYLLSLPKARVNYIVYSVDSAGKASSEVTSAVVNRFSSTKDVSAAGDVFADAFISPQGFDAVVAGKGAADLAAMRLGDTADRLLLIRGSDAKTVPSSSVSGVQTYSMRMTISLIDARDGTKLREFVINDVTGAGVTEASARAAFIERFADVLATRSELLQARP